MVTLSFLGDISLNDKYRELARQKINPFTEVSPVLNDSDFVVGNLEAVCEGNEGENLLKSPRLKTDLNALNYLDILGVNLVTLANNHVYDNLFNGYYRTIEFLKKKKIEYIGAYPKNYKGNGYFIKSIKGKKIGILNYIYPCTNPNLPNDVKINVSFYDIQKSLSDINEVKKECDFLFLIFHWGADNAAFPMKWQREDAKKFIENGADCIVGHHSHTLQGYEQINNKYVFYSLGNFCFAPFMSNGNIYETDKNRHSDSVILKVMIENNNTVLFDIIPIKNENEYIIRGGEKTIKKFYRASRLIPLVTAFWSFYSFYLNFIYKIYFYFFGNGRNPIERLSKIDKRRIKRFLEIAKNSI